MNNETKAGAVLPVMDDVHDAVHREIIEIFLQRRRNISFMREERKILLSLEKTADLTGYSETMVSRLLIRNGLRAGRRAFPQSFLDYMDNLYFKRHGEAVSLSHPCYEELYDFWNEHDGSMFKSGNECISQQANEGQSLPCSVC